MIVLHVNTGYDKQRIRENLISNFESKFEVHRVCSYHFVCPCSRCVGL